MELNMSRKQLRLTRQVQAIMGVVDGTLENWGIEMHRGEDIPGYDDREPSERFAAQIGEDEAVEYEEVYALICDVALEVHRHAVEDPEADALRAATDVRDQAEIARLRSIIKRAYSNEGWDIGSVKSILLPGLDGYEQTTLPRQQTCGHNDTRVNRQGHVECNDCGRVWVREQPTLLTFYEEHYDLGFDEQSTDDGWWMQLELIDDNGDTRAALALTDVEALTLAEKLTDLVTEGRKRYTP
jgi:hypothetical protein